MSSRPSSAGISRGRNGHGNSGNGGYGFTRGGPTGVTNLYTAAASAGHAQNGLYGYSFGTGAGGLSFQNGTAGIFGNAQAKRPSSAGHSRSARSSGHGIRNPVPTYTGNEIPGYHHGAAGGYGNAGTGFYVQSPGIPSSRSSNQRPKSAGSIRRSYTPSANNNTGTTSNTANVTSGNTKPHQLYSDAGGFKPYNAVGGSGGATTRPQRPLSANATAHTTNPALYGVTLDQWGGTAGGYKLYGPSGGYGAGGYVAGGNNAGSGSMSGLNTPTVTASKVPEANGSRPSHTAVKLRQALDLSTRLESETTDTRVTIANLMGDTSANVGITTTPSATTKTEKTSAVTPATTAVPVITATKPTTLGTALANNAKEEGNGDDGETDTVHSATVDGGLAGAVVGLEGLGDEATAQTMIDDEEMDGKRVMDSRSHPEVSLTTTSASVEFGNGSSVIATEVRNSSVDSFANGSEEIQLGLSTVPNQFCTKRDAIELGKLLLLSVGTRGGIVPSSSAVMDMYMVGKVVGVGSYGKVRAAWHRLTGAKVAIKTYDKGKLKDPAHWKRVHSEIKITEQLSHPRIARMYEAVETPKRMHLIMECLDGGNLCSYVKAKKRLSEEESRRIFFQILQGLEYLHSLGVSHRDIKLENILFANDRDIKLIDFGFSTVCQPGKRLKVFCGTPSYMAPEIVRRVEYDGRPVDMWSMGILLYALLCGCFPFRAKAYPDLYRRIARGTFSMPEELSAPVKDLLRSLLNVDPNTRMTAHSALRHPWLVSQLSTAIPLDRLKADMTFLISDRATDDLDDQVLAEMVSFGVPREEMIRLVLTKTHSSLSTFYYLLLNLIVARRVAQVKKTGTSGSTRPKSASSVKQGVLNSNYELLHRQ